MMKTDIRVSFEEIVFIKTMKTKIDEKIEQNSIHEADEDENQWEIWTKRYS